MLYVNNNGDIYENDGPTLRTGNRAFLYGDGLFESVRIMNGSLLNFKNHYARMIQGAEKLKIRVPSYMNESFFVQRIEELIRKSEIRAGGRCRISIDRAAGGTFKPESNEAEFFIEVYPVTNNLFELNAKGLEVDIYMDMKKEKTPISNFKTKNGLLYVLASISANEKGLDDYFITNFQGGIIEATSSNLFVVSNGVLYTPGLEEGCLAGTMRMQVINLALQSGMKVYECNLLPQNLLIADEIFLTNAISGLKWVGGYRTKRYGNNISRNIVSMLNAKWNAE